MAQDSHTKIYSLRALSNDPFTINPGRSVITFCSEYESHIKAEIIPATLCSELSGEKGGELCRVRKLH